jgi:hypothetical protein
VIRYGRPWFSQPGRTGGVLTVGIVIAVMEIRNMSQTRRAEVTLQYLNMFTSPETQERMRHVLIEQRFESIEE